MQTDMSSINDLRLMRSRLVEERRTLIGRMLPNHAADSMSKTASADKLQALQHILQELDAAIDARAGAGGAGKA